MKNLFLSLAVIATIFASCTPETETPPPPVSGGINTGDLRLFVIDTAKVNTVTATGTSETTILNRKQNINSYIGSFSLNNGASKFVYLDNQSSFINGIGTYTKTVRVANANGSGDIAIYTAPASTNTVSTEINYVKYGISKIYFTTTTQTFVGGAVSNSVKINSTNFDGTGLLSENYNEAPLSVYRADLSSDGKYLTTMQSAPNIPRFVIIDRTGDNGAGSVYYQENLTTATASGSAPIFSYDNKFAYYAYAENQTLKINIINMATKASEIKTIATGFTATSAYMTISVASDNNRGVLVVDSSNNLPTKTYVFNLANGNSTSFNNNDKNVVEVYAY